MQHSMLPMEARQFLQTHAGKLHLPGVNVEACLLAVSGGADSTAMLHMFALLRDELPYTFAVGHVHHGTGRFADEAMQLVEETCASLEIPFHVKRVDVPGARQKRQSFEAVARELRYCALREIAKETGAAGIVTAHTRDDLVETTLLYLLRGAGLAGIAGMQPVSGDLWRPLLQLTREELTGFLHSIGARFLDDPMNEDTLYTRVRIRRRLKPFIEEVFGTGAWNATARSAALLAGAEETLKREAKHWFDGCTVQRYPRWVSLDSSVLTGYLEEQRYRVMRHAVAHASDVPVADVHLHHHQIVRIQQFIHAAAVGSHLELPDGVILRRRDDCIVADGLFQIAPLSWSVPGSLELPDGSTLQAEERPKTAFSGRSDAPGRVEWVDADRLESPLRVRPARSGDRVRAMGSPAEWSPVSDLLRGESCERGQV
ncbi:tRNA lysidine(34) synthetase TilS, partial [bacterium]|nr:tRNA lysidine(34) synthetase TilS [bacterium]